MPYSCARFYVVTLFSCYAVMQIPCTPSPFWVRSNGNGYPEISKETVMSCHFSLPRGNAAASVCVPLASNACCQMAGGAA